VPEGQSKVGASIATRRSSTPKRCTSSLFESSSETSAQCPPGFKSLPKHLRSSNQQSVPVPLYSGALIPDDTIPRTGQADNTSRLNKGISQQLHERGLTWAHPVAKTYAHGTYIPVSWLVIFALALLLVCSVFLSPHRCSERVAADVTSEFSAWGMFKSWVDQHMEAAYMVWKLNTTHRGAAQNLYIWSQENWQVIPSLICCVLGGMPLTRAIMTLWSRQGRTEPNHQPGLGTHYLPSDQRCAALPTSMLPMQSMQAVQSIQAMQPGPDLRMMPSHYGAMSTHAVQMPYMHGSHVGPLPLGWYMPVRSSVAY